MSVRGSKSIRVDTVHGLSPTAIANEPASQAADSGTRKE